MTFFLIPATWLPVLLTCLHTPILKERPVPLSSLSEILYCRAIPLFFVFFFLLSPTLLHLVRQTPGLRKYFYLDFLFLKHKVYTHDIRVTTVHHVFKASWNQLKKEIPRPPCGLLYLPPPPPPPLDLHPVSTRLTLVIFCLDAFCAGYAPLKSLGSLSFPSFASPHCISCRSCLFDHFSSSTNTLETPVDLLCLLSITPKMPLMTNFLLFVSPPPALLLSC